ncbi:MULTISPECIES: DUF4124 domain-containing protein [Pseudomonas]|uniref:DUF4124 domain-containing protein n=1 Tax=Pseudomonas nitroreducens TaxID=46680 RepID=A0A6G6J4Z4_PSENT|nr:MULTISPECIES: DUF4124 domain-containing protein [Pseudomonas]MBG6289782.1 DUF4124 domain-containing protein [Pseudomonas nitroreducens]MCJ1880893.1 DUF4124 domain-containing protein [Pseudomonas nitroreducens]MCJ1895589.1 DUF4124 domain-containing protein [Pseudomonas nitroreducens]NMZ60714.1 DUF4124 domain-containing protein [Pseudomonas nitroreducens]NNN25250.1 DUF4124 domain-containing protein [Pseudomonas nitroreducens]
MRLILTALLLAAALPASAQIYKYTDANGKTVFTNQPPTNVDAKPVELPPTNTVGPQAPIVPAVSGSQNQPAGAYAILALSNLPNDEALRQNNGTFTVNVVVQPPLAPDHQLQLLLDGQPYGVPTSSTSIGLQNIDRGDHTLAVQVLQGSRVIQASSPVSFTLQRISTNSPARKAN